MRIFSNSEIKKIKENMARQFEGSCYNFDVDKAFKRYQFILFSMNNKTRTHYFNNIKNLCAKKIPRRNECDYFAYDAAKIQEWFFYNYIISFSKFGELIFISRQKDNNFIYYSSSGNITWSKDELDSQIERYENQKSYGDYSSDDQEL